MPDSHGIYDRDDFRRMFDEGITWRDWPWVRELVALCVRKGEPGRILDVGCGLGYFVELCNLWGIPCDGIEGSEYAISEAKSRGVRILQFDLAGDNPFPFLDATFSTVILSEVIEHLERPVAQRTLRECWRCLIPGGALIVLSPSRFNRQENREPSHINLYSPSEMKREVENAGFVFCEYLDNWPRPVFTDSPIERLLWRQVCRFYRPNWLSAGASVIADKPRKV